MQLGHAGGAGSCPTTLPGGRPRTPRHPLQGKSLALGSLLSPPGPGPALPGRTGAWTRGLRGEARAPGHLQAGAAGAGAGAGVTPPHTHKAVLRPPCAPAESPAGATTAFVGQCFVDSDGEETLRTAWLLREEAAAAREDWKATR